MEDNNHIDPNKIIPMFNDCKGTCKTPIGCTCGKVDDKLDMEVEIFSTPKNENKSKENSKSETPGKKDIDASLLCTCGKNPGGACGCKTGEGCGCGSSKQDGKKSCSSCSKSGTSSCCSGKNKLEVYDWLNDLPEAHLNEQMVEVQFKNTRKGYYLNSNNLELYKGDIVAVEATPGHDIGEVTLTGKLVPLQMAKNNYRGETKRIYRLAKPADIEKQAEAKAKEHKTMLRSREIAEELRLNMKISDVEYQGDGNKAIFYYIADERVDFRQLIKVYASEFRVKIEMKQIGARQEAGRVGGIGPCGRELCCSSSMSNFISVSTSAARLQDIPLNPQKLAGQCGKLKCCLNFEVDTYVEAQRKLPNRDIPLETKDATYYNFKTDVLSGTMIYSTDKYIPANLITINKDRAHEVIRMNKNGKRPANLATEQQVAEEKPVTHDLLENESITRFDSSKNNNRNKKKKNGQGNRNNENKENRENNSNNNRENRPNNNGEQQRERRIQRPQRPNLEKKDSNNQQQPSVNKSPEQSQNENNGQQRDNNNRNRNNRNRNNRNRPPRNNDKREDRKENGGGSNEKKTE